jgi:hypothetical protein
MVRINKPTVWSLDELSHRRGVWQTDIEGPVYVRFSEALAMLPPVNRLMVLVLATVLALGGLMQCLSGPAEARAAQNAQIQVDPGGNAAAFRSMPLNTPYYNPGNYYPFYNYNGPVGGYLSGAADVINAQGQFMTSQQQAFQMRERYHQMKIETRRKNFDEFLYERERRPTEEDERERNRLEQIRRSRNDPPLTEIWSGKALNDLLLAIQQQQAQRIQSSPVSLNEEALKHINVTTGKTQGSLGLLRDGGKLRWPLALVSSDYDEDRKKLNELAVKAVQQAEGGAVDGEILLAMNNAIQNLSVTLKQNKENVTANDYINGKRYLNELANTVKVLQDPSVANYATRKWSAKGSTVAELADNMAREGLKFAPAVSGDEGAYQSLHLALVAYYVGPEATKKWDPLTK